MLNNIWVEKYRPSTLEDIVLSVSNKSIFTQIDIDGEIPNLLFSGKPGIGKTSLAKIIVNSVLNCQYLYINASDENGIETIRSKVTNFSKTKSIDGKIKVIILDEVDGLTIDAQRALRNTMEEYSKFVRFILTANYNHRVIPALQSRCQTFDLTPPLEGCKDRIDFILKSENVTITDSQSDDLSNLIKLYYPDIRKVINEIQKNVVSGNLTVLRADSDEFSTKLMQLVQKGAVLKVRKYIIENEERFNGDYNSLMKDLFNLVDDSELDGMKKKQYLLTISEYMYRSAFVADLEINFYSCLIALSKI